MVERAALSFPTCSWATWSRLRSGPQITVPYEASWYSVSLLDGSMDFNRGSSPFEHGGLLDLLAGDDHHQADDDGVVLLLALGN